MCEGKNGFHGLLFLAAWVVGLAAAAVSSLAAIFQSLTL
jgi:hypothetical protein